MGNHFKLGFNDKTDLSDRFSRIIYDQCLDLNFSSLRE